MKRKLLFAALCAMSALGTLRAQSWEDITSFYLTNADFEGSYSDTEAAGMQSGCKIYQPSNWTVTRVSGNEYDRTILKSTDTGASGNFTITDIHSDDRGAQTFWTRLRWGGHTWNNGPVGNSTELKISQTANLPAGKYRLSADMVFASKGNAGSNYSSLRVINSSSTQLVDEKKPTIYGTVSGNGTLSFGDPKWTNYTTDEFTLANAEDITFMGYVLQYWQNEIQAGFDNFKLERECSEASPWELPTSISNWSLNSTPWVSGATFGYNDETYAEHFAYNTPTGDYLKYTVSNVPTGYYQVKLTVKSSSTSSRDSGSGVIAVTDGDTKYTSIVCGDISQAVPSYNAIDATTGASPVQYTLDYVFVDNGTLEVTVKINEEGPNWIIAKMDGIKFYGDIPNRKAYRDALAAAQAAIANNDYDAVIGTERSYLQTAIDADAPATTEACGTAAIELETKTNTFTSAKDTYEALTREIAKAKALGIAAATADGYAVTSSDNAATALSNTQALKVAEYNLVNTNYAYSVDLGTWTKTGSTGSLSSQHWSGEAREYLEQSSSNWSASSWTIKYNQNVTLPAGNYVFKVAGRQANSDGVTLSLTVKNGETELGTVSDFPRGDSGLGITTDGATSFDPEDTFCNTRNNNGNNLQTNGGNGWEWRYVKFTLADDATVNVSVDAVATEQHMWVSFCDATVLTDNAANISLIAYNIALGSAQTVFADPQYANVTGSEKTALQNAIAADTGLDKTDATVIDAATTALDNARTAFTEAKSSYDALVAAKAVDYPTLAYATAAKRTALDNAQAATATSASDADTKTAAITTASRKYYESHALGEGVSAEEITIGDPRFAGLTNDDIDKANWKIGTAWKLADQNNGEIAFYTTNSLIDGDGNNDYQYIRIQKSDNNGRILQTINLEPGKYMMTAAVRCQSGQNAKFEAFAGGVWVDAPQNNNTGGIYGNGWNDVCVEFYVTETSDIEFGVKSNWGKNIWWTATRFRLVKLPTPEVAYNENTACTPEACPYANVTLTRNISANTWSTFVVPFDIDNTTLKAQFGNDVRVSEFSASDKTGVTFTPMDVPAITANKPVLLRVTSAKSSFTFNGVTIKEGDPTFSQAGVNFVGNYAGEITIPNTLDTYFVKSNALKKSTGNQKLLGFRAYFTVEADSGVKAFFENGFNFDDADGIKAIDNGQLTMDNAEIFNLAGQKMSKLQKGVNIVNGKKVLVK